MITTSTTFIKIPETNADRKILNKKGFSSIMRVNGINYYKIPDNFHGTYSIQIIEGGGLMGNGSSIETWTVHNKKNNKHVVTIQKYRDGDYPPPDSITWG